MSNKLKIFVASDSLGETAEMVARATAEQFRGTEYEIKKYPYINNEEQIKEMIEEAAEHRSIVVFTTVLENLRHQIVTDCARHKIPCVDLLSPLMKTFEEFIGIKPIYEPGIIHKIDERYFKKIEAIEFAVKYDDGKDPRGVTKADVVIIGISRTSKTPLSMYLAHKNMKVANIPLVPEVPVPEELYRINPRKIIGLTTNPVKLEEIRIERLKALGLHNTATYANMERILEEIDYAEGIMKRIGCPIIDVSNKAVEETANIIEELFKKHAE